MLRAIETQAAVKAALTGRTVVHWPYPGPDEPDESPPAQARARLLHSTIAGRPRPLVCVSCGRPVSDRISELVEIDSGPASGSAGVCHRRCLVPWYRLLGPVNLSFADLAPALADFDVQGWACALHRGQAFIAAQAARLPPLSTFVWHHPRNDEKSYCLCLETIDGQAVYATVRHRVQRFGKLEAERAAQDVQARLSAGRRERNALGYMLPSMTFGSHSDMLRLLPRETFAEVVNAYARPYYPAIGAAYNQCERYYAPLLALRVGDEEEYFRLFGCLVFISEPQQLDHHIKNWRATGVELSDYYCAPFLDDASFDSFMEIELRGGASAIIDPLLDGRGKLVSGWRIVAFESIVDGTIPPP